MTNLLISETHLATLSAFAALCATRGVAAWLVGGAVRDALLGRPGDDLDVAVAAGGLELARAFADVVGGAFVPLDDARNTGRVVFSDTNGERLTLDVATLRAPSIEDDLRLRDFTVNAIAVPLQPAAALHRAALLDPCGGAADLAARVLRPCAPATLQDDPLRIVRAFRIAAGLGLRISADLAALIRRDAPLLALPAAERIRDELLGLLTLPNSAPWLRAMDDLGVLTTLFPELEPARTTDQPHVHFLPVLAHSLETVTAMDWLLAQIQPESAPPAPVICGTQEYTMLPVAVQTHPELALTLSHGPELQAHFAGAVGATPRVALLRLATLLHDNAKPQTKRQKPDGGVSFYDHQGIGADVSRAVGKRLRLSRAGVSYVAGVVRAHMRPGQLGAGDLTLRAVLRLFRDTGGSEEGTAPYGPDVLLHAMADHLATRGPFVDVEGWGIHNRWTSGLLDVYWDQPATPPPPLVDGTTLMRELGVGPGPQLGALLREIHEAQAAKEITSSDEALALARRILMDDGR